MDPYNFTLGTRMQLQRMTTVCLMGFLALFSTSQFQLDAAWSPAIQISPGASSINSTATPLVIDSSSVALVGWLNGPIGISQISSSSTLSPQEVVWTTPQTIFTNTLAGAFPSFPTMSVDVFGVQTAAFSVIQLAPPSITLEATRRVGRFNPWPAPVTIPISGIPGASALAIGNLGNLAALLALTPTGTPPFDITLVQLPANATAWLPSIILAQDNSTQPVVAAMTRQAMANLAWKVNTPTLQIQTMRFNFATQEGSPMLVVPLPPLTLDIIGMDLTVDDANDTILIYVAQFASGNALYSSTLLSGESTWSNPLLISDPANNVIGASIAADAVGNATILWGEEVTPTQQFVRVATLPLGGVPIFQTDLTDRNALNTLVDATSRVVMDSFGNAAAIWGITMGGTPMVQTASKAVRQGWSAADTLSTTGILPLIALSDQGTAVAVWIDSITSILMGSRNLFLFALQPPTDFFGRVVHNQFLNDSSYVLKMQWEPSPAPHVVSYEIFKNGKLIGVVPAKDKPKFLQTLHSKHVRNNYTLVAIASNGNRSFPVIIAID